MPKPSPRTKSPAQIAAMKSLSQQSASWLLGHESSRHLRDNPQAPRNADSTYDASDLLAWAVKSQQPVKVNDQQVEQSLIVADHIYMALDSRELHAVADFFAAVLDDFGAGTLAVLIREMVAEWKSQPLDVGPTPDEIRRDHETKLLIALHRANRSPLDEAHVCTNCGKRRLGRTWIKNGAENPNNVVNTLCPKCEAEELATLKTA